MKLRAAAISDGRVALLLLISSAASPVVLLWASCALLSWGLDLLAGRVDLAGRRLLLPLVSLADAADTWLAGLGEPNA
jgi:hypothetical protein